ncbi:MAG: hypothetical protein M3263_02485 [Thermoproteota archaeon]|nr:hypothetical protein [Thermoproteota archaeon]
MMKSLSIQDIFTKGLLFAAAFFSVAATGVFASSAILGQQYLSLAFAQEQLSIPDTDTDSTTTNTTATATTNNFTEGTTAGMIGSLQLASNRPAPEWVTIGYWEMESDMSLFGGTTETEPTVTDFYAIVEMTRLDDGTFRHDHRFSDFRQSDILFTAQNTTSINGTMTVITEDAHIENVSTYITLQNNLISIFIDPEATHNHFGPTPITGVIMASEHLQEISNVLAPLAAAEETGGSGDSGGGAGETGTTGGQDSSTPPMTADTIGNATGQ